MGDDKKEPDWSFWLGLIVSTTCSTILGYFVSKAMM